MTVVVGPLIVGIIVGFAIWLLGRWTAERREKKDAIRDLMTYRGDYSSTNFRRSLNKVSITFHKDKKIREQVQDLNEAINGGIISTPSINRKIVKLIFDLCQNNGFKGITQYDIDQSFPEQKQEPGGGNLSTPAESQEPSEALVGEIIEPKKSRAKNKKEDPEKDKPEAETSDK